MVCVFVSLGIESRLPVHESRALLLNTPPYDVFKVSGMLGLGEVAMGATLMVSGFRL